MNPSSINGPAILLNVDGTVRDIIDDNNNPILAAGGQQTLPAGKVVRSEPFVYLSSGPESAGDDNPACYVFYNGKLYKTC